MGPQTHPSIEAWQKKVGIKPATAEVREAWSRLQELAFETIKIAELETSGIRHGDGNWYDSDVITGLWNDLKDAVDRLREAYRQAGNDIDNYGLPFLPF